VAVAKPQNPLYEGDWEERMDKTSGRIFYVNHRTGEQTGQRPEEMNYHLHKGTGLKGIEGEEDHKGTNATLHRLKMTGNMSAFSSGNSDAMKISAARARSKGTST